VSPGADASAPRESFAAYRQLWDQRFPAGDEYAAAVRLMQAARIVERVIGQILEGEGLTMSQWTTLTMLNFADDGALALGRIAGLLGVHTTTITTAVDRLEVDRSVVRNSPPDDRRSVVVVLTATGRRRIARVNRLLGESRFGFTALAADDVAALSESLSPLLPELAVEGSGGSPSAPHAPATPSSPPRAKARRRA
jgi:DNA-binding MarR family transcriptional regulator